ncbi:MAG: hypothetical protein U0Q07_05410 [Acidimicrobiales bacterium]
MVGTKASRWGPLLAVGALLVGIVGLAPAAGAAPPSFAITPLPTTVAAGTTLTVSGVGCPQSPPPTVDLDGQPPVAVQLWRTAEGRNAMGSAYQGSAAASTWRIFHTLLGLPSEQFGVATPAADGSWTVSFALPWFDGAGQYEVSAWCGSLGPAGPFDLMGSAPGAPPVTASTTVTTTATTPVFTHLADGPLTAFIPPVSAVSLGTSRSAQAGQPQDPGFSPPAPGPGDLASVTPGDPIDLSGTGCHPPSDADPPTQREVELVGSPVQTGAPPLGPTQQRLPDVAITIGQGGELTVEPKPLPSPGGFLVRAALNADGSWSASTTIPADSAATGTYVVVAQCLTGASGVDNVTVGPWQRASQVYSAVPLTAPSTTTTTPPPTTVTPAFTG